MFLADFPQSRKRGSHQNLLISGQGIVASATTPKILPTKGTLDGVFCFNTYPFQKITKFTPASQMNIGSNIPVSTQRTQLTLFSRNRTRYS